MSSDQRTTHDRQRGPVARPRWLPPTALVLSGAGLAVSAYLVFEHFTASSTLVCSDSGAVNCAKVTTSSWSYLFGIPVSVLGLLYFALMTLLCMPAVWRSTGQRVDHIRAAIAGVGLLFVVYLVWAEVMKVGAICLWCTAVHIITLVLTIVLTVGIILSYEE